MNKFMTLIFLFRDIEHEDPNHRRLFLNLKRNSASVCRNEQELTSGMCLLPTSIVLLIFMGTGSPFSLLSLKSTFFRHDVMSSPILKTVRVCESSGNVCTNSHAGPAHKSAVFLQTIDDCEH